MIKNKLSFTLIYSFLSSIVHQMETNKVRYNLSRDSMTSASMIKIQIFDTRFKKDVVRYLIWIDVKEPEEKTVVDISFTGSLFDTISYKSQVHGVYLKMKPLYNRIEKLEK